MFICFKDKKGFFHGENLDRIGFFSDSMCTDRSIKRFYIKIYSGTEYELFEVAESAISELGEFLISQNQMFKIGSLEKEKKNGR